MAQEKLVVGAVGEDVARLHEDLQRHGFEVSDAEVKRRFFGPATREAVLKCQQEHGLPCSGDVDGPTTDVLAGAPVASAAGKAVHGLLRSPDLKVPVDVPRGNVGSGIDVMPQLSVPGTRAPRREGMPGEADDGGSGTTTAAPGQRVSGRIILEHGLPASRVNVRLYQRGFGGTKTLLREVETDEKGGYQIPYTVSGMANIEVHAVGADGNEIQLSRTKFGAASEERLDLIAPTKLQPAAAEFSRLKAAVSPYLHNTPEALKGVVERSDRPDISNLVSSTGWNGKALALASTAYEHADTTKMPAEALYALYRVGFPTDAKRLARVDRHSVETALGSGPGRNHRRGHRRGWG